MDTLLCSKLSVCRYNHAPLFHVRHFILLTVKLSGVQTPIDKQSLVHHLIGFQTMYMAVAWRQDFTVTVGVVFAFLEVSTPFVCIRWALFKHNIGSGSLLQAANTITLFFFFVFGRVLVQIYVVVFYNIPWLMMMWFEKAGVETGYKVLLLEFFIAVLINVCLNFWWTWLIVKQVYRTLTRQGDKGFDPDNVVEDTVEETDVPKDQGKNLDKIEMTKLDNNTTKSDQVDLENGK